MVIETFRDGNADAVGRRFKREGRMLPEGVVYHASWLDLKGTRCFQIMEAPDVELLGVRIGRWNDLTDFEIVPIQTSADFWATMNRE